MMTQVRWDVIVCLLVLVGAGACTDEMSHAPMGRGAALHDSIDADYEQLQRAYASADTLPRDVRQMRGAMEAMHGQMRQHRRRMGRGGRHGRGMHGEGGMHGEDGMHDRAQRRGRGGRRDSARMWEWHQQMQAFHAQMAQMHAARGAAEMAERHRQLERRHRSMMGALPSEAGEEENDEVGPSTAVRVNGADLYTQHCATCHGPQGEGSGPFPPLAGSAWVTGEEETAIRILLNGLQGPVEVQGRSYRNVMPAFGRRLTDAEIAELLSYLRTSWGNDAEAVDPAEVREVRTEHSGRAQPWTASELRENE